MTNTQEGRAEYLKAWRAANQDRIKRLRRYVIGHTDDVTVDDGVTWLECVQCGRRIKA